MFRFVLLVCVVLVIQDGSARHRGHHWLSRSKSCSKNYNFDYLMLTVQWPETFCQHNHCVKHRDRWLIHGAWPQRNDGSWPSNCCTEHPFSPEVLNPIKTELESNWKTLKTNNDNEDFWQHEYTKHGTCASKTPLLSDELSYFENSLRAFEQLKIEKWLAESGIVPSADKLYPMETFYAAIKNGFGHPVVIKCKTSKTEGLTRGAKVVSEIYFCLEKNSLSPIDCKVKSMPCGGGQIAYLPSKP